MTRKVLLKRLDEKYKEYNYILKSKKDYFTKKESITFLCPTHGEFEKKLPYFIYGKNFSYCPKCIFEEKSQKMRMPLEEYEKKLHKIHKNRYKVLEYNGFSKEIKIFDTVRGVKIVELPYNILKKYYNGEDVKKSKLEKLQKDFYEKYVKLKIPYEIVDLTQYKKAFSMIELKCPIHGIFKVRASYIISNGGNSCPKCSYDNLKTTITEFTNICNKIHKNKYDYKLVEYEGNLKKIKIICPIHGVFLQRPKQHKKGEGCPKCSKSKGEMRVSALLENNGILYNQQHHYSDCINPETNHVLYFDFYLPDYNVLIEFDGRQHYEPIKYFGGNKEFIKRKRLDLIKDEYCVLNNIKLIRIKYNTDVEALDIKKILRTMTEDNIIIKDSVVVIDFLDNGNRFTEKHSKERMRIYESEGYTDISVMKVEELKTIVKIK